LRFCKLLILLVGERGFEPPTPWSRTRCSTRLSHSPNMGCGSVSLGRGLARFTPRMRLDKCSRDRAQLNRARAAQLAVPASSFSHSGRIFRIENRPRLGLPQFQYSTVCIEKIRPGSIHCRSGFISFRIEPGRYFLSPSAGVTTPGKIPSIGARRFCSMSGAGSGLRGSIWSRCAAL
jgi:hypothetical protein